MPRWIVLTPALLAAVAAILPPFPAACAMLVLLLYLPGRLTAELAGLASEWERAGRTALSLILSVCLLPVALNVVWAWTHAALPLLMFLAGLNTLLAVAVALLPRDAVGRTPQRMFTTRAAALWLAALAAFVTLVIVLPYWPGELRGHPVPAIIHDYIKHHAVLYSLQREPLPLHSPFYAAGPHDPVYYYHFFYLIPATLRAVVPQVSIELAFALHGSAVAIGLITLVWLWLKRLTGGDGPALLGALLCSFIGGLDIVGVLARRMHVITLDAWADTLFRLHNLLTQMIWTPQNTQGLLIVTLAAYLLSHRPAWVGWFVFGPLLGASLIGSSVWVAFGGLLAISFYVVLETWMLRARPAVAIRRLAAAALIGLMILLFSAPQLVGYAEMSRRHHKGLTLDWPRPEDALLGRMLPPGPLANLLDLPWRLAVELGPLLVLPLLLSGRTWLRLWLDAGARYLLVATLLAVGAWVTVRSYFTYNDFGQKVMMVTLVAGAVCAAQIARPEPLRPSWRNPLGVRFEPGGLLGSRPRLRRGLIVALLAVGSLVGFYQAPLNAVRRFVPTTGPLARLSHPLLARAEREGAALHFMRHDLPADAIVQANWGAQRVDLQQLIKRRIGITVLEADTEVFMPRDTVRHQLTLDGLEALLQYGIASPEDVPRAGTTRPADAPPPEPADARRIARALRELGITHVFVGTVERRLWRNASVFDDARYFERLYRDDVASVYAVRRSRGGQSPSTGTRSRQRRRRSRATAVMP